MSMQNFERQLADIDFAASQQKTLELPRNYAMRGLHLMLESDITIANAPSGESSWDSAPAQLVKRIEIVKNGSETIKSIDFPTLHRYNQLVYGTRPHFDDDDLDVNANGTYNCEVHAYLPFAMPRSVRPIDTMHPAYKDTTFHLIVTFGAVTDISDNEAADISQANTKLKVSTNEMMNVPADLNFSEFKQHVLQKQVSSTTSDFQIDLGLGNRYRGLLIKSMSDSVDVNTIIDHITLKSGTKVYKSIKADQLRAINKSELGIETMPTGYYYLDLCKDGRLMEALNSAALSSLELVLDVNSVGTTDYVMVYPEEIVMRAAS